VSAYFWILLGILFRLPKLAAQAHSDAGNRQAVQTGVGALGWSSEFSVEVLTGFLFLESLHFILNEYASVRRIFLTL
jgi:hypothetical protein